MRFLGEDYVLTLPGKVREVPLGVVAEAGLLPDLTHLLDACTGSHKADTLNGLCHQGHGDLEEVNHLTGFPSQCLKLPGVWHLPEQIRISLLES
jgi:hypothetical protein